MHSLGTDFRQEKKKNLGEQSQPTSADWRIRRAKQVRQGRGASLALFAKFFFLCSPTAYYTPTDL